MYSSLAELESISTSIVHQCNIDAIESNKKALQSKIISLQSKLNSEGSSSKTTPTENDTNVLKIRLILYQKSDTKLAIITALPSVSIERIRELIFKKIGIPQNQQCLICKGVHLEDGKTLGDYNIQNGDEINVRS